MKTENYEFELVSDNVINEDYFGEIEENNNKKEIESIDYFIIDGVIYKLKKEVEE